MLTLSRALGTQKAELISYFRERAQESTDELLRIFKSKDYKKQAEASNKALAQSRNSLLRSILQAAHLERWSNREITEAVLMTTYANYVVMIEARNGLWPYDYMAFSRRIGELWEPFCALCFEHSTNPIKPFVPPTFSEVKRALSGEMLSYIESLTISSEDKARLIDYYNKVWSLVASGSIKMALDLHFELLGDSFNVDFKSGFGSNEKGNTNRLLLVGAIYHNLDPNNRCLLLVRSPEDTNNNYLQTLARSGVWEVYCGEAAYEQIERFTGFDLGHWIHQHATWEADLASSTLAHLAKQKLLSYVRW